MFINRLVVILLFMPESYQTAPQSVQTLSSLWRLEKIILDSLNLGDVVQKIVDSVLIELGYLNLGYRIVVLGLIDKDANAFKRVSISQTEEAKKALEILPIPFHEIVIPLDSKENYCIKAIENKEVQITNDWADILVPVYSVEDARKIQEAIGIKTSMVFPVIYRDMARGMLIFSMVKSYEEVSEEEKDLIRGFTDIVGIAVQNAMLYSDLEKTKNELDEANKQLTELDKLKDEFVSLASHELRTPMAAIKGSISTILEGYAGPISNESKEFLTAAYNENDRLIRLVNNLLNTSRIESGKLSFTITQVKLDELIRDVVKNLHLAGKEKNLYITYEQEGELPLVLADEDKIKEVVINLIGNALKFTSEGGITIKTEVKDGMVVTQVKDTGTGIHKEDFDLLFKKFSQVKRDQKYTKSYGGTGLGLYLSQKIIEGLGGKIWLESEVGKGTTFYFTLPIVK